MAGGARKRLWSDRSAKLIRELFADEQLLVEDIAERFGTTTSTVKSMLTGRTYSRAGGPLADPGDERLLPERFRPEYSDAQVRALLLSNPDAPDPEEEAFEVVLCDECGHKTEVAAGHKGRVICDDCTPEDD